MVFCIYAREYFPNRIKAKIYKHSDWESRMKYQCEHSDTGICYKCFQKAKDLCDCGVNMHTEHDDRKFEINGKEVCIGCWVK